MKNLIKSKIFVSAFLLFYFSFFIFTIFIFDFKTESGGVENFDYGFPFSYFHEHCFGGNYLWFGLLKNILFATVCSYFVGLIFNLIWSKISSRRIELK